MLLQGMGLKGPSRNEQQAPRALACRLHVIAFWFPSSTVVTMPRKHALTGTQDENAGESEGAVLATTLRRDSRDVLGAAAQSTKSFLFRRTKRCHRRFHLLEQSLLRRYESGKRLVHGQRRWLHRYRPGIFCVSISFRSEMTRGTYAPVKVPGGHQRIVYHEMATAIIYNAGATAHVLPLTSDGAPKVHLSYDVYPNDRLKCLKQDLKVVHTADAAT